MDVFFGALMAIFMVLLVVATMIAHTGFHEKLLPMDAIRAWLCKRLRIHYNVWPGNWSDEIKCKVCGKVNPSEHIVLTKRHKGPATGYNFY